MRVSLLAAVAANGVIGRDGGLPWHVPADLRYFKQLTLGHTLVMGRRTWDSVGRPLPSRRTVVVTRQAGWRPAGGPWPEAAGTVEVAGSLEEGLERARVLEGSAVLGGPGEVFVVGGAEIYREALPVADRLYLTRIEQHFPGDTHFPAFDPDSWRRVACDRRGPEPGVPFAYRFEVWDRAGSGSPAGTPDAPPV